MKAGRVKGRIELKIVLKARGITIHWGGKSDRRQSTCVRFHQLRPSEIRTVLCQSKVPNRQLHCALLKRLELSTNE